LERNALHSGDGLNGTIVDGAIHAHIVPLVRVPEQNYR
jgi:hypothetical protein